MSFYPKLIGAVCGVCAAGALIYAGDERGFIRKVLVQTFYIRQEHELVRADRPCDRARCVVCIDIIGLAIFIHAHRSYDRKVIAVDQII